MCMDPSSPLAKRTYHLLQPPDISLANDSAGGLSYYSTNTSYMQGLKLYGNLTTAGLETDTDGDGLSDRAEYIAGTDPTKPTSGLSLEVQWNRGQVEISFPALGVEGAGYQDAERHYRLESSASAGAGAVWSPVTGFADYTADSGSVTLTCAVSPEAGATRFYRLCVWLQQKP